MTDQPHKRPVASRRDLLRTGATGAVGLYLFGLSACKGGNGADRVIRLGLVTPSSGSLAPFAGADDYVIARLKPLLDKGIAIGGKVHAVQVIVRDSQSNPKRAAEVAQDLIDKDKVDLLLAAGTADTTNPTADQAESAGVPCITTDAPWEAWFMGRHGDPAKPFEWTYHFFWGLEQIASVYTGMWQQAATNRTIGALWSNDPDGSAIRKGVVAKVGAIGGFKLVDAGLFAPGSSDFSAQIGQFKAAGVEIVTGLFIPPDFATFWTQCAQQGFHPKIVTVAKALLFQPVVQGLGERGHGLSSEVWWSASHPFKSSLTGASAGQICADYVAKTGKPWGPPLGFKHALFEVAVDALKRSVSLDPGAIRDAIRATSLETIAGHVSWTGGPNANVSTTPLVGGQWGPGGAFGAQQLIVYDREAPTIPVSAALTLLS
jgi:branched-chain amino acid transport system substrate-binding protein